MVTEIHSWSDLNDIRNNLSGDYVLKTDLGSGDSGYDTYASSTANGGDGWAPIGDNSSKFTGTFDGEDHTISGLYINRPSQNEVGLFGYLGGSSSQVTDLGMVNGDIEGDWNVGSIAGYNDGAIVAGCSNTGAVSGSSYVGGITGSNRNYVGVYDCWNTGNVSGSGDYVGGIAGYNDPATTSGCYNTGDVSSSGDYVGGIAGSNRDEEIKGCYNTGSVSGDVKVGGLAGENANGGTISNGYNTGDVGGSGAVGGIVGAHTGSAVVDCYNTGAMSGSNDVGGIAGYSGSTIVDCLALDTASAVIGGGSGTQIGRVSLASSSDMKDIDLYTSNDDSGLGGSYSDLDAAWDMATAANWTSETWSIDDGDYYPILGKHPIEIHSWSDLHDIRNYLSGDYKLKTNLDSNSSGYDTYASSTANGGAGWAPIGDNIDNFTGTFDGEGHTISDLNINRGSTSNIGLFGVISGSGCEVSNIGLLDGDITGYDSTGGIVGNSYYVTITDCYSTGSVSGEDHVGGIVGDSENDTIITNCRNTGAVSGNFHVGGISGRHSYNATVTESYNTGPVSGFDLVGGVVGDSYDDTTITDCYNIGDVTATYTVGGVAGVNNANATIEDCYSTGALSGYDGYIGGIAGDNWDATITDCLALDTASAVIGGGSGTQIGRVSLASSSDMQNIDLYTSNDTSGLSGSYSDLDAAWSMATASNWTSETWSIDSGNDYPILGEPDITATTPTVSTDQVDAIQSYQADGNGSIDDTGGEDADERGFVWNIGSLDDPGDTSPDNSSYHYSDNETGTFGAGAFSLTMANLTPGQTYHVRAYAHNGEGYSYGGEVSFTAAPIEIHSWSDLHDIRNDLQAGYVLKTDLDSSDSGYDTYASSSANGGDGWDPIGVGNDEFYGKFDGGGHTISDLYIDRSGDVGLFGWVYGPGEISDVGLVNGDISGGEDAGAIAGHCDWEATITRCYNTGSVSGGSDTGGIVGDFNDSYISDCYNDGNVTGGSETGGIVGYSDHSEITNCYNTGEVGSEVIAGGIAGRASSGTITDCLALDIASRVADYDTTTLVGRVSLAPAGDMLDIDLYTSNDTSGLEDAYDDLDSPWNMETASWWNDDTWGILNGDAYPVLGEPVSPMSPTASTDAVDGIQANQADGNGVIEGTGGEANDERGFVWDTFSHLDPGDTSPANSSYGDSVNETGAFEAVEFSLTMTGLTEGQTYYVRAYSKNTGGYSYGGEVQFYPVAVSDANVGIHFPLSVTSGGGVWHNGDSVLVLPLSVESDAEAYIGVDTIAGLPLSVGVDAEAYIGGDVSINFPLSANSVGGGWNDGDAAFDLTLSVGSDAEAYICSDTIAGLPLDAESDGDVWYEVSSDVDLPLSVDANAISGGLGEAQLDFPLEAESEGYIDAYGETVVGLPLEADAYGGLPSWGSVQADLPLGAESTAKHRFNTSTTATLPFQVVSDAHMAPDGVAVVEFPLGASSVVNMGWVETPPESYSETMEFSELVSHLSPDTTYEFVAVLEWDNAIQEVTGNTLEFTTEARSLNSEVASGVCGAYGTRSRSLEGRYGVYSTHRRHAGGDYMVMAAYTGEEVGRFSVIGEVIEHAGGRHMVTQMHEAIAGGNYEILTFTPIYGSASGQHTVQRSYREHADGIYGVMEQFQLASEGRHSVRSSDWEVSRLSQCSEDLAHQILSSMSGSSEKIILCENMPETLEEAVGEAVSGDMAALGAGDVDMSAPDNVDDTTRRSTIQPEGEIMAQNYGAGDFVALVGRIPGRTEQLIMVAPMPYASIVGAMGANVHLEGDQTDVIGDGDVITVRGSIDSDGTYVVISVAYDSAASVTEVEIDASPLPSEGYVVYGTLQVYPGDMVEVEPFEISIENLAPVESE